MLYCNRNKKKKLLIKGYLVVKLRHPFESCTGGPSVVERNIE